VVVLEFTVSLRSNAAAQCQEDLLLQGAKAA
jgi:hypothetical protein